MTERRHVISKRVILASANVTLLSGSLYIIREGRAVIDVVVIAALSFAFVNGCILYGFRNRSVGVPDAGSAPDIQSPQRRSRNVLWTGALLCAIVAMVMSITDGARKNRVELALEAATGAFASYSLLTGFGNQKDGERSSADRKP